MLNTSVETVAKIANYLDIFEVFAEYEIAGSLYLLASSHPPGNLPGFCLATNHSLLATG